MATLTNMTEHGLTIRFNPEWPFIDPTADVHAWLEVVASARPEHSNLSPTDLQVDPGARLSLPDNFAKLVARNPAYVIEDSRG